MMQADLKRYEELMASDAAQALLSLEVKWPPLPGKAPTREFPVHVFPPKFRQYAEALTQALQVPLAMVCSAILGVLGIAVLGTRVSVMPGYIEPVQLFIVIASLPSERKSAVFSAVLEALRETLRLANDLRAADVRSNELKKTFLEKSIAKAQNKGDETEAARLSAELDAMPKLHLYDPPLTDATMEALVAVMDRNGGKASIASDEGALFNIMAGIYAKNDAGANVDGVLQGYSDGTINQERISRPPLRIPHAKAGILVTVQPQVMQRFYENEAMLERGACSRFLPCAPESQLGKRDARTAAPVPADISEAYGRHISRLTIDNLNNSNLLKMDALALELFYQWSAEVEKNIGPGGQWHGIANGFEGKLVGNTIRIAGLLKLADSPDCTLPVSVVHFRSAVEVARYFLDQALAITGKAAGLTPAAKEVLDEIKKQGQSPFSPSDLKQRLRFRKNFKDGTKADEALACLAESGYIRQTPPPEWRGTGRKPEALYEVHPDLLPKN